MHSFARVAIAKYHTLGGSTNSNLFCSAGGWKSKMKVLAGLVSFEVSLLGLQIGYAVTVSSRGCPSLCAVCVLISSSDKDSSPIGFGSTHVTSFYLIFETPYLQIRPHSEVIGARASTDFGETQFSP